MTTRVFVLAVTFLSTLPVNAFAQSDTCELDFQAADLTKVQESVQGRNLGSLIEAVFSATDRSGEFKKAHGENDLKQAIEQIVKPTIDGRTEASPQFTADNAKALTDEWSPKITQWCEQIAGGARPSAIKLSGGDSKFYALLGTVNSLEGDGGFSSGLEASFWSETAFRITNMWPFSQITDQHRDVLGSFEIIYSEIGNIEEGNEGPPDVSNPFEAGGGFFRLNTSGDFFFSGGTRNSGLGFRLGGGLTTQPSEAENDVSTRARGYGGLVFRANYGDDPDGMNGKGELFLGYAKDKFWRYETVDPMTMATTIVDETSRVIVDARMDVPGLFQSENVRMHARIFADVPASGDGPSDVRISLLLTVNLGAFFPAP